MLPQYISMQVAESILFVGKAVRILRNPSKSFKSHQRVLELQDAKQASMHEEVLSGNFHAKGSFLEMLDHRGPKLLPQSQVEKIALMIQALKVILFVILFVLMIHIFDLLPTGRYFFLSGHVAFIIQAPTVMFSRLD